MKNFAIIFLISAGLLLGGCAVANAATPNPTDPLVSIHSEGGLCRAGTVCSHDVSVLQNGTYTVKDGSGSQTGGSLDSAALAQLKGAIDSTDFNAIRSKPFTGTCPTAYDGQEYMFTFYKAGGGTEVLDSCKSELDMNSVLFKVDY